MSSPIDAVDEPAANTRPLILRLTAKDGSVEEIEGDIRAAPKDVAIARKGVLYVYRGDDNAGSRWVRLYREATVLRLDDGPAGTAKGYALIKVQR